MGISEYDFQLARPREEIRKLFDNIGFSYKVGKFNAMFHRAITMSNTQEEKASVRAMMEAIKEMHHMD